MSIRSGFSLESIRHQGIFGTNAHQVHWRIYAALGGDELNYSYRCFIMASSDGNILPRYWPFVRRKWSPVPGEFPAHKGQWRGTLMFSLICAWINCWVNNYEAGDLSRHRVRYDAIVFSILIYNISYDEMSHLMIRLAFEIPVEFASYPGKNVPASAAHGSVVIKRLGIVCINHFPENFNVIALAHLRKKPNHGLLPILSIFSYNSESSFKLAWLFS